MKKIYTAPAINVVRIDGNLMNMAYSETAADSNKENFSKHNVISFDDDEDDVTSAW